MEEHPGWIGQYTIFGEVIYGWEVIDLIAGVARSWLVTSLPEDVTMKMICKAKVKKAKKSKKSKEEKR